MKNKPVRNIAISLLLSLLMTVICTSGLIDRYDCWMQDLLFQQEKPWSGNVVVIGIDEEALTRIGAYNTWDRHVMARALEALNADPEKKPAVVAIDTLYSGETEADADEHLAKAAEELGCVVTATAAAFGTKTREDENGSLYIDDYAVLQYEHAYPSLFDATENGHINAMYDSDGIMRHALLYVEPETGEDSGEKQKVYSMAYRTAGLYLEKNGREATEPPTDSRGRFYVSFSTKPGGYYDGVSIADLIEGKVPADYYAGKIVLIGPYAAGLQDVYFTPIERAEAMYGVEFQANVIDQVLSADYKLEVPAVPQIIALFVILFFAFLLFMKLKAVPSVITAAVLVALGGVIPYAAYQGGYIMHILWMPVCVVVVYLVSLVIHYVSASIEKQRITKTFERYVAPEIVREILKEGTENLSLGGKLCDIAVLFVDVRGFTTMSERLDPERVVYILNRYLTMTSECIERYRGTLDKFVGDATMAFWGAPLPEEDSVFLAVRTAKAIVDGAEEVSRQLKEDIGEELHVGVGVHFGPAVVGNMGAEKHMDYTAIGDTVNTAARLEANAPGGCVYISRMVADKLGDRIKCTSLGDSVKLKGKADGFEVLKLDWIEE